MKVATFVVIATIASSGGAYAQVPADAQQAPSQPAPSRPAVDPRRDDIRVMESVLTQALQKGAQDLARQLKMNEPNSAFVTGTGRARGFILEGYGVFFDVDVPGMKQSVVWSAQMVQLAQDKQRALQVLATLRPDDPLRKVAVENIRQIDRLMAAAQSGQVLVPSPLAPTQMMPPRDRVEATAVAEGGAPAAASLVPLTAVAEVRDPNELYTESVKSALIDSMLRYGPILKIGDNEWLSVAASDSDGPQIPGQLDETSRIVIRVKGSDLSAFQAGKLTREEVLKRVEV